MEEIDVRQGDIGQSKAIPGNPGENRDKPEFRVIMIGKIGVGKSCLGNSILGKDIFESEFGGAAVTQYCMRARAERFERDVQVIDTPGLFDTSTSMEKLTSEISRCITMSLPGPHAFLFVSRLSSRFSKEDQDTISQFAKIFGESLFRFAVVVFTCEDELKSRKKTIDDFLQGAPKDLKALLEKCGNRHVCFDNLAQQEEKDSRCQKLIEIVDTIQASNEEKFFTNEVYSIVMKPIEEDSETTLLECRKDRALPRNQQRRMRTRCREKLQASRDKLNSPDLFETGSSEVAHVKAHVKQLELRLNMIQTTLANPEVKDEDIRRQVEAIATQRIEDMRSGASENIFWLLKEATGIIFSLIVSLLKKKLNI